MLKVEYSSKRRNLSRCMGCLPRLFWLKKNRATFHSILVQNLILSCVVYLWVPKFTWIKKIMILDTNVKEKIISYSTTRHALEDVFKLFTKCTNYSILIFFEKCTNFSVIYILCYSLEIHVL